MNSVLSKRKHCANIKKSKKGKSEANEQAEIVAKKAWWQLFSPDQNRNTGESSISESILTGILII